MSVSVRWGSQVRLKANQTSAPRRRTSSSPCCPVTEWTTRPGRTGRRGRPPQTPQPAPGKPPNKPLVCGFLWLTALKLLQGLEFCKADVSLWLISFPPPHFFTHFAGYCEAELTVETLCLELPSRRAGFYLDYLTLQGEALAALCSHYFATAGFSVVTWYNFPMTQIWMAVSDIGRAGLELKYIVCFCVSQRLGSGLLPALALHRLQAGPQLEVDPRAKRVQSQFLRRQLSVPLECQQPLQHGECQGLTRSTELNLHLTPGQVLNDHTPFMAEGSKIIACARVCWCIY